MARPMVVLCLLAIWSGASAMLQSEQGEYSDRLSSGGGLTSEYLNSLLEGTVTVPYVLVPSHLTALHKRQVQYAPARFRSQQYEVCRPSSNEIVKFLHALHLARSGSTNQLARLCSDAHPASEIDTNVRFVG